MALRTLVGKHYVLFDQGIPYSIGIVKGSLFEFANDVLFVLKIAFQLPASMNRIKSVLPPQILP